MPFPLYSVRVLQNAGVAGTYTYIVPAGHRFVLRAFDAMNAGATSASAYVMIGATIAAYALVPGTGSAAHVDTRQVAYAGEHVALQANGTTMHAMASGYLFSGDGGQLRDVDEGGYAPLGAPYDVPSTPPG